MKCKKCGGHNIIRTDNIEMIITDETFSYAWYCEDCKLYLDESEDLEYEYRITKRY